MRVSVHLLAAVVKWTAIDTSLEHLQSVAIRHGVMTACDGHRIVQVPLGGVMLHDDIALHRDDVQLAVDIARSAHVHEVDIGAANLEHRTIQIGHKVTLSVRRVDCKSYPSVGQISGFWPSKRPRSIPLLVINPDYLSAMAEVEDALPSRDHKRTGVTLSGWGGELDGVAFEGRSGALYMIMPMKKSRAA